METKPKYIVACEYGSIDRQGRLSAINIFDGIKINQSKGFHIMTMFIVGEFFLKKSIPLGPLKVQIKILDPNRKSINTITLNGAVTNEERKINLVAKFDLLKFTTAGKYHVRIIFGNETLDCEEVFDVKK